MSLFTNVLILFACVFPSQEEDPLSQANLLMKANRIEAAEKVLQDELEKHPENGRVRHTLARIVSFDGRTDEAVTLLREGITDDANKTTRLNLLMLAGEFSLMRAEDGPTVTRRRGTISVAPQKPDDDKPGFTKKHLAIAEESYQKALKLAPGNSGIMKALAKTLTLAEKPEAAIDLWKQYVEQNPLDADAVVQLATLQLKTDNADESLALLKSGLEQNPNDAAILELLSTHYGASDDAKAAKYWKDRHEFSQHVPDFVELEFNEENVVRLEVLETKEGIEQLLKEKTPASSEMLAIYCWRHPHNDLEDRAFVELGDRRAVELLRGLMDNANATCTVRGAATQLARSKPDDLFDRLVALLPGDRRPIGMEMDIANALDVLGDARAIPELIAVLAVEDDSHPARKMDPLHDHIAARGRAAIALAAFDTEEVEETLLKGRGNPQIRVACVSALYRLTGEEKYLKVLEASAKETDREAWLALNRLTEKMPEDESLQKILTEFKQRIEEKSKR